MLVDSGLFGTVLQFSDPVGHTQVVTANCELLNYSSVDMLRAPPQESEIQGQESPRQSGSR